MPIPMDPNALLRRDQLADALTWAGSPTHASTLTMMAARGGGRPFNRFGRAVVYKWSEGLSWARAAAAAPSRARRSFATCASLPRASLRTPTLRTSKAQPRWEHRRAK